MERDPIAQKHLAKIQTMRGTYDSMGNRVPPPQLSTRRSKSSSNLSEYQYYQTIAYKTAACTIYYHEAQVKTASDYDPITDDFLHHSPAAGTQESLLAPPDASPRKSYAKNEKKHHHKMRPKSAPKHRRPSPVTLDYPSNEEYFSEEELRLPVDDDEGSSAISDQDCGGGGGGGGGGGAESQRATVPAPPPESPGAAESAAEKVI